MSKKDFYKHMLEEIDKGTWRAELRVLVVKEIREGIRQQFDKLCDTIKGIEEEITRKGKEINFSIEQIDKLMDMKVNPETPDQAKFLTPQAIEDHKADLIKELQLTRENKIREMGAKQEGLIKELVELFFVRDKYKLDADILQEQMLGKLVKDINGDESYAGGLDAEIKSIESSIVGGLEYRRLVEREYKKL